MHHAVHHVGRVDSSPLVTVAVKNVIETMALQSSPSEIRNKLIMDKTHPLPAYHQISYLVHKRRHGLYERSSDVFASVLSLIHELPVISGRRLLPKGIDGKVKCAYLVMDDLVAQTAPDGRSLCHVDEVVIDATHKTNGSRTGNVTGANPQFEVYVMMITFRGEGYPISYMFLQEYGTIV